MGRIFLVGTSSLFALFALSIPEARAQDVPPPPGDAEAGGIVRVSDDAPGARVELASDSQPAVLWYAPRARMAAALESPTLTPFAAACLPPCTLAVRPDDYVLAVGPADGALATFPLARRVVHLDADATLRVGIASHQGNRDVGAGLLLGGLFALIVGAAVGIPLIELGEPEVGAGIAGVGAGMGCVLALVGFVFALDSDEGIVWVSPPRG